MSDVATVAQLVLKHRHEIVAFLYSLVPDYHAVEDLFQEVSLVAIRKADEFQDGTHFAAWVRAIARHKIREHLRRRRGASLDDALFEGLEQAFEEVRGSVDLDLRKDSLRRCVADLQQGARQILSLRYEDGLDAAGIAARTGRSRASVNSLLQRIREILRDCVDRRRAEARA
jgi:RNA polymerase sigma-70 factor (ECF subfamily)